MSIIGIIDRQGVKMKQFFESTLSKEGKNFAMFRLGSEHSQSIRDIFDIPGSEFQGSVDLEIGEFAQKLGEVAKLDRYQDSRILAILNMVRSMRGIQVSLDWGSNYPNAITHNE